MSIAQYNRFVIHTNAPCDQPVYPIPPDGSVLVIDAAAEYKLSMAVAAGGAEVLSFATSGLTGRTVTLITQTLGGVERTGWRFQATLAYTSVLTAGDYIADLLRTDGSNDIWVCGFPITVARGITTP